LIFLLPLILNSLFFLDFNKLWKKHSLNGNYKIKIHDSENNFQQFNFGLTDKNQLIPLFEIAKAFGFIKIYEARKEVNDAFEIENWLLESKEGLSLSGINSLEWEALSKNALLIVLEIP
jgi:quercetin 2,3-dioxygenase